MQVSRGVPGAREEPQGGACGSHELPCALGDGHEPGDMGVDQRPRLMPGLGRHSRLGSGQPSSGKQLTLIGDVCFL